MKHRKEDIKLVHRLRRFQTDQRAVGFSGKQRHIGGRIVEPNDLRTLRAQKGLRRGAQHPVSVAPDSDEDRFKSGPVDVRDHILCRLKRHLMFG